MAHLMESAEAAATELVRFALFDRKLAKEAFAFIADFEWPAIGWQYQAVRERATTGRLYSANLKDHPVIRDLQTAPAPTGDDLITQTRLLAHQVIAAKTMMRLGLLLRYSVRFHEDTDQGRHYPFHSSIVDHLSFLIERHGEPGELAYEVGRGGLTLSHDRADET